MIKKQKFKRVLKISEETTEIKIYSPITKTIKKLAEIKELIAQKDFAKFLLNIKTSKVGKANHYDDLSPELTPKSDNKQ